MKIKFISLITITVFLFSCGNESTENVEKVEEVKVEEVKHEEHQTQGETKALVLNDGEKWKVNEEMMPPITNIEVHINTFVLSNQKDYSLLATDLQEDINSLISSCTMKGKSHDELHKWLVPFIGSVNELAEAGDDVVAEKFEAVQASMATFNEYFE